MRLPENFIKIDTEQDLDFYMSKVPSRNIDIPVPGFYQVLRVEEKDNKNPMYRKIAFAKWKKNIEDEYHENEVSFRISPLFNNASIGPKGKGIIGREIWIREISVDNDSEYNGIPYNSYKVIWELLES